MPVSTPQETNGHALQQFYLHSFTDVILGKNNKILK